MSGPKTILVVEDDEDIRWCYLDLISAEGYFAVPAFHGKHALEILPTLSIPGLVIIDLMMPVMDGITFYHEMRKLPGHANVPVVFISAGGDFERVPDGVRFLRKPVDLDELILTIRELCEGLTV